MIRFTHYIPKTRVNSTNVNTNVNTNQSSIVDLEVNLNYDPLDLLNKEEIGRIVSPVLETPTMDDSAVDIPELDIPELDISRSYIPELDISGTNHDNQDNVNQKEKTEEEKIRDISLHIFASSSRPIPYFVTEITFGQKMILMERNQFSSFLNQGCRTILKSTNILTSSCVFLVDIAKLIMSGCSKVASVVQTISTVTSYEYLTDPFQRLNNTYRKILSNVKKTIEIELHGPVLTISRFFQDVVLDLPSLLIQSQDLDDNSLNLYIRAIARDFVAVNSFSSFMDLEMESETNTQILEYYRTVARQMMIIDINDFIINYCKLQNWFYNTTHSLCLCINEIDRYLHFDIIMHNTILVFQKEYTNILNYLFLISNYCETLFSQFRV